VPQFSYAPASGLTLGSLAEGVLVSLYGQTAQSDASGTLATAVTATDRTLKVSPEEAQDISSGLIEVDTELMRISTVNEDGTITVHPAGRGVRGTVAASHAAGAEVRMSPIVPYSSVIREINAELRSIYPRIASTCYVEFDTTATGYVYSLPDDAGVVLDVRQKDMLGDWQRIRGWEVEHGQNTTDFPSGKALRLALGCTGKVRVIYGKPFGSLSSLTQTLADAGVPDSLEDVIRTGVICRILPTLDISRLSVSSTSSSEANDRPPTPGTGVMVRRELKAEYRERLDSEIRTFRSYFPARPHITR
jgi:hypothetical protein